MAVELGAARGLSIIHVPDPHGVEADGGGGLGNRLLVAFGTD